MKTTKLKRIINKILDKLCKHLLKELNVKYVGLYFLMFIIVLEAIIIGNLRYIKRYVYGLGEEEGFRSGISNNCYETKKDGKVCLVEKKVYWYERTDK